VLVSIPGLAGMLGHIKSGRLRALAVTGVHRSPQLPEVPTLAESGLKGYSAYVWLGLLAPRGTPAPIIDRLNRESVAVLASSEVKNYMYSASIKQSAVARRTRRLFPREKNAGRNHQGNRRASIDPLPNLYRDTYFPKSLALSSKRTRWCAPCACSPFRH
jgi:hypothetical protein